MGYDARDERQLPGVKEDLTATQGLDAPFRVQPRGILIVLSSRSKACQTCCLPR